MQQVVTMFEIDKLASSVARAYLAVRGNTFNHLGVQLPLTAELLALAIKNNIVSAHLENAGAKQGQADALLMLRHMVAGETLTPLGALVMDQMFCALCADVRQMLNEGKDPMDELAREHRESLQ